MLWGFFFPISLVPAVQPASYALHTHSILQVNDAEFCDKIIMKFLCCCCCCPSQSQKTTDYWRPEPVAHDTSVVIERLPTVAEVLPLSNLK